MAAGKDKAAEPPAVKRRRLKGALRHEREAADITQQEAADALFWSVSKIIRIEAGAVSVSVTDLRALMELYKVTNEQRQAELIELARGSRKQPWSEYNDVYGLPARTLFDFETAAKIILKYEPTFIPGLLQTEEYARALLSGIGGHSEDEIERMVRGRIDRQELLDQDPRPRLAFILGEAAVSRAVGGRGVMLHQLDRLKELAARPGVSLQILSYDVGAHPRMGEAFTILEFTDETLDDLLYLENAGRESINREDPDQLAAYHKDFVTLQKLASPSTDFATIISRIQTTRLAVPSKTNANKDSDSKQAP